MPFARVNGLRLHYQCSGQGRRQLVIIHGFTGNSAGYYLTIVPLLARDFNVITYDLRGHGKSDMPRRGYTSADMAGDLHALMQHVGFDRAHLMGHSFGGEVALQYVTAHPECVRSLILADTRVRIFQPRRVRRPPPRPEIAIKLKELGVPLTNDQVGLLQELFDDVADSIWPGSRDPTHPNFARLAPFAGNGFRHGYMEHLVRLIGSTTAGQDLRSMAGITHEKLSRIRQPVLAVYGDQSVFLPTLRRLRGVLPSCQAHVVRGFGHMLPVTAPRLFVQLLRNFIVSLDRGRPLASVGRA
jgi:pimeloyl-ACP methyl ester carboxylesterase